MSLFSAAVSCGRQPVLPTVRFAAFPEFLLRARQIPAPTRIVMVMGPDNSFEQHVVGASQRLAESGVAALGGLYDLTADRLVRYASAITRNQHDAEDAVQAALVRVAAQPRVLAAAQRPWAYLLRIVRNEALQAARKRKRWSLVANLSDLLARRLVDEVEQEESHRAVWLALRKIPVPQAEVVVLKIWEGMTFAQIGEVLDVSTFTAASRYRYAMEKLHALLGAGREEAVHE